MRNRPTKVHTRMAAPIGRKVPEKREQLEALAMRFGTLLQSMPGGRGERFRTVGLELIQQAKAHPYEDISEFAAQLEREAMPPAKPTLVVKHGETPLVDEHGREWRKDGKAYRLPQRSTDMDRARVAFHQVGKVARAIMLTNHLTPWLRVGEALQVAWAMVEDEALPDSPRSRDWLRYGVYMFENRGKVDGCCEWRVYKTGSNGRPSGVMGLAEGVTLYE